jgi:monoamine oxidase
MARVETDDTYIIRGEGGRELGFFTAPGWLEGVINATQSGVEASEMNEAYLREVFAIHGVGYEGRDVKFPGGYAPIFEALSGAYPVRLSTQVLGVTQVVDGVELALQDGPAERFDAVVVTVPLGVLKAGTIAFDPPLSAEKQAAIERMGMGLLDKLYLVFEQPFWDEETLIFTPENGLPRGQFNYWVNLHRYFGQPVLVALNGGSPAFDLTSRSDAEMVEMALQTLRMAYPDWG